MISYEEEAGFEIRIRIGMRILLLPMVDVGEEDEEEEGEGGENMWPKRTSLAFVENEDVEPEI